MFKSKIIICFVVINITAILQLKSQSTNSPYTIFGAGQIEDNGFGVNKALGGTGLAFQSNNSLNNMNPASYSGIDRHSFLFEFGMFLKYTQFITKDETQSKIDGNLRYLAMGLRFTNWWAGSMGLVPFSSVGYTIHSTDNMEGDLTSYNKTYTGNGGINQFYFGNSFKIFKNLSVGINASYFFGAIKQSETAQTINSNFVGYTLESTNNVNHFYLDYGLQYTIERDDWKYTLGLIYGNEKELSSSRDVNYYTSGGSVIGLESEPADFRLPGKYGIGVALVKGNYLLVGFDYDVKNWSVIDFKNPLLNTRNSERYSLGIEFNPGKSNNDIGRQNIYYRLGANYGQSYLIIGGTPIDSKAMTFGLGIPLRNKRSVLNLSCEFGQNGTTNNGMIKENYFLFHINSTINDVWFQKRKYY